MRVVYLIERQHEHHGRHAKPQPLAGAGASLALAISDWDGVHREQVALARRCAALAGEHEARAAALLPWPSPASPAAGDNTSAARLTTLEERITRLDLLGCFETLYIAPVPATPREPDAALEWLGELGDVRTLVGEPAPIGATEWLWPAGLAAVAREAGIRVEQGPWGKQPSDQRGDMGARIREMVVAGRMREATAALGYTYTVTGDVVGGDRRGRLLGFPTANLRLEPSKLTPKNGIYAGWVTLPGASARWPAAVSIGVRPTFGEGLHQQIEAHLLDVSMDLYGLRIQLEFVEYLRDELRFDGLEALIQQMGRDREQSRAILRAEAPDHQDSRDEHASGMSRVE